MLWLKGCSCHNNISSWYSGFLIGIVFISFVLFLLLQTHPVTWAGPSVRGIEAISPQMQLQTAVCPSSPRSSLWIHWWRCRPCRSVLNFWPEMLPDFNLWNFLVSSHSRLIQMPWLTCISPWPLPTVSWSWLLLRKQARVLSALLMFPFSSRA